MPIRPVSPAGDEGISVGEGVRREGVFESSPKGRVIRERRRAAAWRTALAAALLVVAILAAAWLAVGFSAFSVQRGLAADVRDDELLRSVIREPLPDAPPMTVALLTTREGALLEAGVLGVTADSGAAWLLSLPANASVTMGDEPVDIAQSYADGSPAKVVAALESVAGTEVAGYVEIDVDAVSPIASGPVSIPSGGSAADRQHAVVVPLMRTLAETRDVFGLLGVGRMAEGAVRTQLGLSELGVLARSLGAVPDSVVRAEDPPLTRGGDAPVPDAAGTRELVAELASGAPERVESAQTVAPGSVRVEVQNGAGLDGIAGDAARILESDGYDVFAVGNAAQFVYDETLVVHDGAKQAAAQVANALPVGRVIASRGIYAVKGDVLVIVGADWVKE